MWAQGRHWATALGALTGAAYALTWGWALSSQTYNVYGSLAIVPVIVAVNLLLIARTTARHDEPWLPWVLVPGFLAKCLGIFGRYYVAYVVYGGFADAERYNVYASYQHHAWRRGEIVWEWTDKQGTQVMELITTAIYTVIGGAPLAGFFVFGSFAFWGAYLLYRAFSVAVPRGDHKRYALLIFLIPSMLYWPSSIGKESWLLLFLGVASLGAARYFARMSGAYSLLVIGGVGMVMVRPHVTVLFFAALFVGQLFRPSEGTLGGVLRKVTGVLVLGAAAVVLTRASAQFLGIDDISYQAISETVDWRSENTVQGGSEFIPVSLGHPLGVPMAFITLLFRPFPFEAHNIQTMIQSLEGLFLLGMVVLGWRRMKQIPSYLRRNPYVLTSLIYVIGYVLAFAEFGNFGILARQRTLMFPLFFVLLSLPRPVTLTLENLPVRKGGNRPLPSERPMMGASR